MTWLNHFTFFDGIVLLIFLALIARGIWVGFIRQIAVLIAMLAGFIVAGQYQKDFFQLINPIIENGQIAFLISYLILFLAIYIAVILLGLGLKKVVDIALLGWFDKTLGGLLGTAKAVFIASLVFMGLAGILSGSNNFLRKSFSSPYLAISSEYILQFIKDADLRSNFILKEPANGFAHSPF